MKYVALLAVLVATAGCGSESSSPDESRESTSTEQTSSGGTDSEGMGTGGAGTNATESAGNLGGAGSGGTPDSGVWLEGSFGITFPVFGGERLDSEVANEYESVAGAEELVAELPMVGHVITNLSYFAHSHYFTLSDNDHVDVASEIHPSVVPSAANDQIIFDVLRTLRDGDKKIILYISCNYFERAEDDVQAAWASYYDREFGGDQYLAYEDLIQGFVEKVAPYADGYWLDTTGTLSDEGKLGDFVAMFKETDPGAMVTANSGKNYYSVDGEAIYVDSDGTVDDDPSDYKIIIHEPLNGLQDFTHGHVTPLAQGAPPNSWAYDEFTLPNMIAEPWVEYEGKLVLKHAWFPIRERWHTASTDLVFGTEQAYRFAKSITDAGATMTFATTTGYVGENGGHLMADEMVILKEINARLSSRPAPNYEPYVRPAGATLVGE